MWEVEVEGLTLALGDEDREAVAEMDPVMDAEGEGVALGHSVMEAQGEGEKEAVLQVERETMAVGLLLEEEEEQRVGDRVCEVLTVADKEAVELWHTEGVAR